MRVSRALHGDSMSIDGTAHHPFAKHPYINFHPPLSAATNIRREPYY
jgi:hypothetical protein